MQKSYVEHHLIFVLHRDYVKRGSGCIDASEGSLGFREHEKALQQSPFAKTALNRDSELT